MVICDYHLCNNEVLPPRRTFCSTRCGVKYNINARRIRYKDRLVAMLGGECALCGYKENVSALQFHHLDPSKKSFILASSSMTKAWKYLEEEANKCLLLCANCHAEVHHPAYNKTRFFDGDHPRLHAAYKRVMSNRESS